MPDLFEYSDYRKYLRDIFDSEKARDPKFSLRFYAQKIGFKSSGYLSDILSGKKNLTEAFLLKCAKLLKVDREREEYFIHLVHFNQAKTLEEKNRHYEKMMTCNKVKTDPVQAHQFEYFSQWHHAAIRELLHFYPFQDDYAALARQLDPKIKATEAKRSIELLSKLGLISRDERSHWRPTAHHLTSGTKFEAFHIQQWHHQTLELALRGLTHFPMEMRGNSTLTLPLTPEKMRKARQAIKNLRLYLMALSENGNQADRVVQFNFQFFPLSVPEGEGPGG